MTVPELPGCKTHGETYEKAIKQAQYAIEGWIETNLELGRPIPAPRVAMTTLIIVANKCICDQGALQGIDSNSIGRQTRTLLERAASAWARAGIALSQGIRHLRQKMHGAYAGDPR